MIDTTDARLGLDGAPLFAGLDGDELALVAATGRERRLARGETLFSLGESAVTLYVVAAGTVALTLPLPVQGTYRVLNLQEMEPGAMLGWSALVPPHKYTFGARAMDEATLVAFPAGLLTALFDEHPRIQRVVFTNLTAVIASRLTQLQAIVVRDFQRRLAEGHV